MREVVFFRSVSSCMPRIQPSSFFPFAQTLVTDGNGAHRPNYMWHCNRHTFASRLVMAVVDLRTVGELLGCRTAQMTQRYAHLCVNHKQTAVERISMVHSATKLPPAGTRSRECLASCCKQDGELAEPG
jgi:hypothetical protein